MKHIVYLIFGVVLLFSCQANNAGQKNGQLQPATVKEVLQTTNYTYLLVAEGGDDKWLAVPKMMAAVGDEYYYEGGMLMTDFESKELNRTFEQIWFLGGVSKQPIGEGSANDPHAGHGHAHGHGKDPHASAGHSMESQGKITTDKEKIEIEPTGDGITIGELFANKDKYANQQVVVKGKVVKFSEQIMGKNWIHIQDGTDSNGEYDLTVTSQEKVQVGQVVTLKGVVTLDKDFGYGYFYKVIIEEAILVN